MGCTSAAPLVGDASIGAGGALTCAAAANVRPSNSATDAANAEHLAAEN